MTFSRNVLVASAFSFLGITQAWDIDLPPCLNPFQPFVYSGCFAEGDGFNALGFRSTLSSSDMTVEECVAECKGNGYRYAGLEYYGVCFCGATVNGALLDDGQCTFPCNGNASETCGGNNKLSVWQDPTFPDAVDAVTVDDYKYLGCYTDDSSQGRTLSFPVDLDTATFTTSTCLAACEAQGYPFAGTEFGSQCWCGVVLANDTAVVDASQCAKPCQGDSTETCGGSARLSLYVALELESLEPCGSSPPSSSTTTTCTTSSSSSTSTSTSTPCTTSTASTTTTTTPCTTSTTMKTTTTTPCTTSTTMKTTTTTSSKTTLPMTTTKSTPTTKSTKSTTSTAPLCTSTTTIPPTCEYQCGEWCAPPLPDWGDQKGCQDAYNTCATQVTSCWKQAGWPDSLDCFKFQSWCGNINNYCSSNCNGRKCSKSDCFNNNQPHSGGGSNPPKTTTSVFPCPPTTTTKTPPKTTSTTPPTTCPPAPTNICTQPSSGQYGFGPGNPVGGIPLPLVACNDQQSDWWQHPFKLYDHQDSQQCGSYSRGDACDACAEACKEQYDSCQAVYVKGCQSNSRGGHGRSVDVDERGLLSGIEAGLGALLGGGGHSGWGSGDDTPSKAQDKCQCQYTDCLAVNKNVNPSNRCKTWGTGW